MKARTARPEVVSTAVELLTGAEVAALLRVHPKQIYRLLARGLPAKRVGAGWRFVRDEVLAWSSKAGTTPSPRASARSPAPLPEHDGAPLPALVAANGDLAIEVLLAAVRAEGGPLIGFVQADKASALEWLRERKIVAAGYHGAPIPSHLSAARLARVHLVDREVGLAAPRRAPRSVRELARLRLATRPPTAGIRAHLDRALERAGMSTKSIAASASFASHREAVCAVLRGEADVALTTSAWAERVGLAFHSLATESYDLVLFAEALGNPAVVALCEALQTRELRRALGKLAGYETKRTGDIRYDSA